MSGLIDIWTLERERMVRTAGGAAQGFTSVVSLGGGLTRQGRRDTDTESGGGSISSAAKRCDGVGAVLVDAAEKQTTAASASASAGRSTPGFVREDTFLSILVDCFGQ